METTTLIEHYLKANLDRRLVRFSDGEHVDEGKVDDVSVDLRPQRNYVKVTLSITVPPIPQQLRPLPAPLLSGGGLFT